MMRSVYITTIVTLLFFSAVLYVGCTKTDTTTTDKCSSITCQHGGTCSNGICYCTTGYTGTYCEKRTCEVQNTATVRFMNKTGTNKTYSVVWDGSVITTLAPGATSDYYTMQAGQHTLHFMVANTSTEACTQSTPVLTVCLQHEYWCSQ